MSQASTFRERTARWPRAARGEARPLAAPVPVRSAHAPTLSGASAYAQITHAMQASSDRLRFVLAKRMTKTAGTVAAAGALEGALGTSWMSFVIAVGAAAVALGAKDVDDRADARAVLDGLTAVALHHQVREAVRKARSESPATESAPATHDDETRRFHAAAWGSAAPASASTRSTRSASATLRTPAELRDRDLSPAHAEALEAHERGEGPRTLRREARRMLELVEEQAGALEARARAVPAAMAQTSGAVGEIVDRLRGDLLRAGAALRRAQLIEEAVQIAAWNGASMAAREHLLRRTGAAVASPVWEDDEKCLAAAARRIDAAEEGAGERARGRPAAPPALALDVEPP
jgi:hypothetical protein